MVASPWTWYGNGPAVDLTSGEFQVCLTSGHAPNPSDRNVSDLSGRVSEPVRVALRAAYSPTLGENRITIGDASWGPGARFTFRTVHLFRSDDGALVAFSSNPADVPVNGTLRIKNPSPALAIRLERSSRAKEAPHAAV